jgi:hypothetical protein
MQIISTSPLLNGAVRNKEVGLKSRSLAYRGASVAINHLVDNARHIWPLIGEPFTSINNRLLHCNKISKVL